MYFTSHVSLTTLTGLEIILFILTDIPPLISPTIFCRTFADYALM